MKNKLKRTTSMLCALTVAAVPMTMSAFTASATEITNTVSDYTLTIPSSFTVANAGWNEIEGGVTASGTLADGKKLVVTAQSDNGWALKSGDNSIGYNLAKEDADYNANAEAPTWEFDTLTADGVSQTAGLIVENYDEAPAGNYSDNVVFTASVEEGGSGDNGSGTVQASNLSPILENGGELKIACTYKANDYDASYDAGGTNGAFETINIIVKNNNGEYDVTFEGDNVTEAYFDGRAKVYENRELSLHVIKPRDEIEYIFEFGIEDDFCHYQVYDHLNNSEVDCTCKFFVNGVDVSDYLLIPQP
ncbi:hypothetical protein CUS_5660 [Ruminococcus albus 8]|uniref:Uncharacterized protein n=1 Tax=Ruminococcus albus 8 TaxID=246199 RepID=E9SF04_RUMAL|nr:hypothetical protein [Ruminococcus albus]EGC02123.1 hypothetical protein CUS_5660 [Ruminococcus albus 8]